MIKADVLVIGSEGAGAMAALKVKELGYQPMILTKGRIGRCGATVTAGADINIDGKSAKEVLGLNGDERDSKEQFFEDTVIEGRYLSNQKMVELHVDLIPGILKEMMDWGMKVEKDLMHTTGHAYARGVTTLGVEIMRVLARQVKNANIPVYEYFMATDLIEKDGRIIGVVGIDLSTGEVVQVGAKAVIIATGGGMQLYPYSTAPDELTGDGHAMAFRAGADFVDMEMVQFMGCTIMEPKAMSGSAFPYCIGPDANGMDIRMFNKFGHRFFEEKIDPINKEHVTRDLLSRGIMNEVFEGNGSPLGGVYFSLKHLPPEIVDNFPAAKNMPILSEDWVFMGFSFKDVIEKMKQGHAIEVGVASHFFCGGIHTTEKCVSKIPGLFAAGEVCGGTEGANRLSGNALTQVFVQGYLAAESAVDYVNNINSFESFPTNQWDVAFERIVRPLTSDGVNPFEFKKRVQQNAWDNLCVVRTEDSINRALANIEEFKKELPTLGCKCKERVFNREWIDALQCDSLVTLSEIIAVSALARKETRGAHYRKDFEKSDNKNWCKNVIISSKDEKAVSSFKPVTITTLMPSEEE